jgi:glutamyl-tRNA synthetase
MLSELDGKRTLPFPAEMKDFVVRKKDGFPAYQLASLADDIYFKVDLVVRGEDLQNSTLAQLYLAGVLGAGAFSGSVFHHHVLLRSGNEKLSKSAGDTSIQELRKQGKKPGEIWQMAATMAGMREDATDWSALGELALASPP